LPKTIRDTAGKATSRGLRCSEDEERRAIADSEPDDLLGGRLEEVGVHDQGLGAVDGDAIPVPGPILRRIHEGSLDRVQPGLLCAQLHATAHRRLQKLPAPLLFYAQSPDVVRRHAVGHQLAEDELGQARLFRQQG
jgi:hypothetical protein